MANRAISHLPHLKAHLHFGGDSRLILLKLQAGGLRAAYVHLTVTTLVAIGIPITVLLLGQVGFWATGQSKTKISPHPRRDCDGAIPDRVASQSGLRPATYDDRSKRRGTAASRRESLLRGLVSAAPECFLPGPAEPHGGDDQTDH